MDPLELADALRRLTNWAEEHAPEPEPPVRRRLAAHFGTDPTELPVVSRELAAWDRPNVTVALEAWLDGRAHEALGFPVTQGYRAGFAELVRGGNFMPQVDLGAVEHVTVPLGESEAITCPASAIWLVEDAGEGALAIMLRSVNMGSGEQLGLEVMGAERDRASAVVDELWRLMAERNVYRGRVLELRQRHFHYDEGAPLTVRTLPSINREQIVLPPRVLDTIERQAVGIARHGERLRASGRHLRRGLLLHGAPGVGKTLTAMYLATLMPERTVVLLTGQSLGMVGPSVDLATALQPAMVVLEDVDLVALDRTYEPTNAVLFELLNAMDGLAPDHDVLFVLTTNRPDLLEQALVSRPGRVDQAVELPLPDHDALSQLLDLYGEGLSLQLADRKALIEKLTGVSPAFIRELLRRAALFAAEESDADPIVVADAHLRAAIDELRTADNKLTGRLIGGA